MLRPYIEKYIQFHTVERVIERGEDLYALEKAELLSIDHAKEIAEFQVQGGKLYRVRIMGFMSHNMSTSCSCPYDWNAICKHTVAALLQLADEIENGSEVAIKPTAILRENAMVPINIPGWEKLYASVIKGKTNYRAKRYLDYAGKIHQFLHVSNTLIIIDFESGLIYERNKVEFRFSNNEVWTTTSNNFDELDGLSLAEAGCLMSFINQGHADIFTYFFKGGFQAEEKRIKAKYDLSDDDDFNDYFKLELDVNNKQFLLHRKGLGLISPNGNKFILTGLKNLGRAFDLTPINNRQETREMGFVIIANDDYTNTVRVHALKAKANKSGSELITHIDFLNQINEDERCIPNDQQKKLISLIEFYNGFEFYGDFGISDYANDMPTEGVGEETLIDIREALSTLQQIFELLKKEKFVYFTDNRDSSYSIKKKDLTRVRLADQRLSILLKVNKSKKNITLKPYLQIDGETKSISNIIKNKSSFFTAFVDDQLYVYDHMNTCLYLNEFKQKFQTHEQHFDFLFRELIQPLSKQFKIEINKNILPKEEQFLDAEYSQVYITEEMEQLRFTPMVSYYNGMQFPLFDRGNQLLYEDSRIIEYKRDLIYEEEFLQILGSLHPDFERQKHHRFFYLSFDELMRNMWFYNFYEQLQKHGIQVFGINDLKKFKYSPFQAKVNTSLSSGQDWFELKLQVKFGNYEIKISDLKKAIINKQQFIQLKNGTVGILPEEWLDRFQKYFRNGQIEHEKLKISKLRFSVIDELYENINNEKILKEIAEKKQRLKEISEVEQVKVPSGIKADLRHYQKEGLNWLNFLDSMKWGGILADDMGLGKTLQMLSFFKLKLKKNNPPALIIVPTTLLFNWENEIAKFSPSLKALYYYGNNRKKDTKEFSKYHLVFTSYGVLVRDIEMFKDFQFSYAVLDESQAIKNPMSQRYKAANLLQAKNKFALTGTPIENSTFDLFAQMNFVNPGFFGDIKSFKEDYSNRIDKDADEEISTELQKLSNPFIMRRTKEQVATELPPKTEDILYCEMEAEQRKIYEAYRNEYRDKILKKIEDDGIGKSKLFILEGLLRLRQICDSPVLLNTDAIASRQSVKIKELLGFITEKTANHKLLIFSQFVGMLQLIRTELDIHQIDYEYLDGKSSKNQRKESVEHFQSNESIRVFLVSLKAGGTGLNLTAADYVFLVDPWWNPAVEEQAIDRCYRIGQDKKVFAYRMICKNTIEEKIIQLQTKKKKIASDIIQTDENLMKTLKPSDIRELFS
jgi:SNF2 family DNA or RNA helicase